MINHKRTNNQQVFDVAILGTGLGGSLLGMILADAGAKVLLLDRGQHPRFTIGESTVPQTSMTMRILATRFSIPEIEHCGSLAGLQSHVGSTCGVKRNFGFVYHHEGQRQRPSEATQTVIPEFAHGPESHLFRQDVDAYLFHSAIRRGAASEGNVKLTAIDVEGGGVRLEAEGGRTFQARFLVDGSGYRSILAEKYALREPPERLKSHSRTLFTHMVDVTPYEDCAGADEAHAMPRRWSQGTLHHLFDGGWLWVIPFNNHSESTNPLVSVGLTYDPRRFPRNGTSPEEEFEQFLSRYPSIEEQFASATPVRDWVSTGRLQYSSKRCIGDRFCLLSHSFGFIDALFSRGLANTTAVINSLATRLLAAISDDDFSVERFEPVDHLQRSLIDYNDRLVNCSFVAFSDFDLWNAWHRVWVVGTFLGWLRLTQAHKRLQNGEGPAVLDELDSVPYTGSLCPGVESFENLFNDAAGHVEAVAEGRQAPAQATQAIMELIRESQVVPPVLALGDASRRHTPVFEHASLLDLFRWLKSSAPPEVRRWYKRD